MKRAATLAGAVAGLTLAVSCAPPSEPAPDPGDAASRPTPRLDDGRPDFNGTWAHSGGPVLGIEFVRPERLPDGSVCVFGCTPLEEAAGGAPAEAPFAPGFPRYRPEFLARVEDLSARQVEADTVLRCYPPGVPRIGPPHKIVQSAREVVFLYDDYNGSFFRVIPVDGRPHRADLPPSYLGDATGSFDGNTLVVETVNFTDETWLTDNGAFHTPDLSVVERLRRVGDTIEYEAVADDPAVLAEPWTARSETLRLTARELEESPRCDDRDLEHMLDDSAHENPR